MVQNEPKRQHTVTNSVLKKFSNPNGLFWVFDRNKNEYREQHPDDTTVVKNFYTFTAKDGTKSYELEKILNTEIESKLPAIIEKIDTLQPIDDKEKEILAGFVALQQLKTTSYRKDYNDAMKEFHLARAKMTFANEKYVEGVIERFNKSHVGTGKEIKMQAKELVDFASKLGKDNIRIPPEQHLRMMLRLAAETCALFMNMDWFFLRAPQNSSFIISDNPFSLIGPKNYSPFEGVGLLTPKAEKAMPLSSKTCLMILELGKGIHALEVNRKVVRAINCRTAAQCDRYIMAKDRSLLERIVKITKIDVKSRQPQFAVSTPFNRD